jgi:hypothetical protein
MVPEGGLGVNQNSCGDKQVLVPKIDAFGVVEIHQKALILGTKT